MRARPSQSCRHSSSTMTRWRLQRRWCMLPGHNTRTTARLGQSSHVGWCRAWHMSHQLHSRLGCRGKRTCLLQRDTRGTAQRNHSHQQGCTRPSDSRLHGQAESPGSHRTRSTSHQSLGAALSCHTARQPAPSVRAACRSYYCRCSCIAGWCLACR